MNPFAFARRRPVTTLLLVVGLAACGVLASEQAGVDLLAKLNTARIDSYFTRTAEGAEHEEASHEESGKFVATSPQAKDVIITQQYVCQIHSRKHIEVCALENGFLQEILVKEGQAVKKGDPLFKILPTLYEARLAAETAEADLAQLEFNNTRKLAEKKVVSQNEVKLLQAKLSRAKAKAQLAAAELNFTNVTAPFDGIVDRLRSFQGSLIDEGEVLTTLSDNSVMWVYFNVPEARYLEYKRASQARGNENPNLLRLPDSRIELVLADGSKFEQGAGDTVTVEGKFNNETGNIAFRADFPNPDGLLRHGQTGTVLIHRKLKDAIVIPQRATFELLDKRYVYAIGEDDVAHQRLITVQHELEDTFVIGSGLDVKDKIVLEGVREVRDGDKLEYEFREPGEVLVNQKYHAE